MLKKKIEGFDKEKCEIWTGFRPFTPDDFPILGKLPKYNNVFLNCGHGMRGYSSIGSSKSLTDLFIGKDTEIDFNRFSADRFMFSNII